MGHEDETKIKIELDAGEKVIFAGIVFDLIIIILLIVLFVTGGVS